MAVPFLCFSFTGLFCLLSAQTRYFITFENLMIVSKILPEQLQIESVLLYEIPLKQYRIYIKICRRVKLCSNTVMSGYLPEIKIQSVSSWLCTTGGSSKNLYTWTKCQARFFKEQNIRNK